MSEIKLNDILRLNEEEIANSKIELNMKAGIGGEDYVDLWLSCHEYEKQNGLCPKCGYWGWYSATTRNFSVGQWVFSFIRLTNNEWLFTSAGLVIDIEENSHAEVKIIERFKPLFGRLIIRLNKGQTFARYTFNLSTYLESTDVKEILPSLYGGMNFPGYDNVRLTYRQLETIIKNGKSDWIAALENQKAVYLITDTSTGKQYVGSATSENGMLLNRWKSYILNGHGGNKELKESVQEKGFDYIQTNFIYSILENYNARVDDAVIIKRESWWKETLLTRIFGYNSN